MRLEGSGGTIIHNRRFARRSAAHTYYSYPNPATHTVPHHLGQNGARREAAKRSFAPGLPFEANRLPDPMLDAGFVAECAAGLLNGLSDAVIGVDRDGRIKTCNAAGSDLLCRAASDLLGQPIMDIFTGENAWIEERVGSVGTSRQTERAERMHLTFDGQRRAVTATICPLTAQDDMTAEPIGTLILIRTVGASRQISENITHYMNPDLIDHLSAGDGDAWKSKDTVATILFADLRGFTAITEEIGAQKTVRLLNKYFTLMIDCISAENGAVDKFAGDSLMAGFGITRRKGDEEDRALRAGIAMLRALESWNTQRISEGRKPMQMGIGMATDLVVSGNIGSPKRMDYTLIGDGVNLASRLESACKQYCTSFLIAESTYNKLAGDYLIREIDEVVVVGRTRRVKIYEVLDHRANQMTEIAMEVFALARSHYLSGNWDVAIAGFRSVLAIDPADKVSAHYIERCEKLKAAPPAHWTGVWTLDSK